MRVVIHDITVEVAPGALVLYTRCRDEPNGVFLKCDRASPGPDRVMLREGDQMSAFDAMHAANTTKNGDDDGS